MGNCTATASNAICTPSHLPPEAAHGIAIFPQRITRQNYTQSIYENVQHIPDSNSSIWIKIIDLDDYLTAFCLSLKINERLISTTQLVHNTQVPYKSSDMQVYVQVDDYWYIIPVDGYSMTGAINAWLTDKLFLFQYLRRCCSSVRELAFLILDYEGIACSTRHWINKMI